MPAKQKNKKACKILGVICSVFCILVSQLLETPQDFPSIKKNDHDNICNKNPYFS